MKIDVAKSSEVSKGGFFAMQTGGLKILLVRTDAGLFAVENSCPHQSQPLDTGSLEGTLLTCRNHGVSIGLSTGEIVWAAGYLGLDSLKTFEVEESNGVISVITD